MSAPRRIITSQARQWLFLIVADSCCMRATGSTCQASGRASSRRLRACIYRYGRHHVRNPHPANICRFRSADLHARRSFCSLVLCDIANRRSNDAACNKGSRSARVTDSVVWASIERDERWRSGGGLGEVPSGCSQKMLMPELPATPIWLVENSKLVLILHQASWNYSTPPASSENTPTACSVTCGTRRQCVSDDRTHSHDYTDVSFMSESSFHATSLEATSSSNEDSLGAQLNGLDDERAPSRPDSGQAFHTERSRSSASKSRSRSTSKTGRRHQGRIRLTDYRDLLNSVITDVNSSQGEADTLISSYIGASFWTSTEKKTLFSALALYGRGELSSLANVISTKTVPEVKVFLGLLDQGVAETDVARKSREGFSFVDVPAAIEIGEECEHALDAAADALAQIVQGSDLEAEKRKHGECWLIDHKLAIELDERYNESAEVCAGNSSDAEGAQDEDVGETRTPASGDASCLTTVPAAGLLRPSSFVRLATNIFMNGPLGTDANWRDHAINGETEPSIFRTALDDLHNLTISLTRRLVQATLYQTMSRLRANDTHHTTWRPVEAVNRLDVETAVDILGLSVSRNRYWAELPRRTRLTVISTAPKYKDGRENLRDMVELTYDEVEAEMGLRLPWTAETSAQDDTDSSRRISDNDDLDSDWFTDITISDADEPDLEPESGNRTEHQLANGPAPVGSDEVLTNTSIKPEPFDSDEDGMLPKPMFGTVSSRSQFKAEDQFLNAIDRATSYQEERQLWDILGRAPTIKSERVDVPQAPTLKRRADVMADLWRSRTQYQAEWEQFDGAVLPDEFQTIEMQDRVRKARKMTREGERSGSTAQRVELNLPLRGVRPTEVEERYFGDSDDDDNLQPSS